MHDRAAGFVSAFVPEVPRRLPRDGGGGPARVLLVSHAATVIALARALVGDRALPLRIACCSLTRVERKAGVVDGVQPIEGAWEARLLGDGSHLKDGNQRDWGFEDIEIADGQVRRVLFFVGGRRDKFVCVCRWSMIRAWRAQSMRWTSLSAVRSRNWRRGCKGIDASGSSYNTASDRR